MTALSQKRIITVTVIVILMAVTIVYAIYDPALPWFPKCLFKQATGLDCPGCGSQRAIHALLTGHILTAFRYNILIFMLLPVIVAVALTEVMPRRLPQLYRTLHSPKFILTIASIIVVWWIIRNLI